MAVNGTNLIWMDLEMSGLDPDKERILEIATIVTDSELNTLAEGPVIAISQPEEVLEGMDEWNTRTHNSSGLVKRVRESTISEAEAERLTIDFLKQWVPAGASPLCGNSIGQDRRFLVRYMKDLEKFVHYRNLDVSTVKELGRRWRPDVVDSFHKSGSHMALDDIRESIGELQHYKQHFFKL